jgi:hypothetical protein
MYRKIMAIQKSGVDQMVRDTVCRVESVLVPTFQAAVIPRKHPIKNWSIQETERISKLRGKTSVTTYITDLG